MRSIKRLRSRSRIAACAVLAVGLMAGCVATAPPVTSQWKVTEVRDIALQEGPKEVTFQQGLKVADVDLSAMRKALDGDIAGGRALLDDLVQSSPSVRTHSRRGGFVAAWQSLEESLPDWTYVIDNVSAGSPGSSTSNDLDDLELAYRCRSVIYEKQGLAEKADADYARHLALRVDEIEQDRRKGYDEQEWDMTLSADMLMFHDIRGMRTEALAEFRRLTGFEQAFKTVFKSPEDMVSESEREFRTFEAKGSKVDFAETRRALSETLKSIRNPAKAREPQFDVLPIDDLIRAYGKSRDPLLVPHLSWACYLPNDVGLCELGLPYYRWAKRLGWDSIFEEMNACLGLPLITFYARRFPDDAVGRLLQCSAYASADVTMQSPGLIVAMGAYETVSGVYPVVREENKRAILARLMTDSRDPRSAY